MSVLNEDIYELCDLKDAIEKKDMKLAEKIVFQFVEIAGLKLSKESPFIFSFLSKTSDHRFISYQIDAPAAVLVTTTGKTQNMNLYLNPIDILNIFSVVNDPKHFFDHFTALMKHEMLHLIWQHQAEEEELFGKENPEHELCNIAQDAKINESDEIRDDRFIRETGITYDELRKDFHYKSSKSSFDDANWISILKEIKDNKNKKKKQSNDNKSRGADQDDVLNQKPKDAKDKNGDTQKDCEVPANSSQVKAEIEKAIKDAINDPNINVDELKSRGIIPGHILKRIFKKEEVKEVINIKDYYRHGLNKILKTTKKNHRRLKLDTHNFAFKETQKREKGKEILAYIDTSGSISSEEVSFFLTQLHEVVKHERIQLKAIPWGTSVHHEQEKVIKGNECDFEFSAEDGGTIVNNVFIDLMETNCDPLSQFVIILTDGYTEPVEEKNYGKYGNDVLWVIDKDISKDFNEEEVKRYYPGTVVYLNQDKEFIKMFPDK